MSARRSPGLGLIALALVAASLLISAPVRAASCSGASHKVTLSSGSVTPGSGTTATLFTFSVVYTSNAGCAPASVQVTVDRVGTVTMTPAGTNYAAGVTFRRTMTLPAGTRPYSFRAVSGSGAGSETVVLTSVSPAVVTVVSPTPAPTPVPPPPPPPPPPTAPPPPPATPTPSLAASSSPSAAPSGTQSGGIAVIPSPPAAAGPGGSRPGSHPSTEAPRAAAILPALPGQNAGLGVWLVATLGGLGLFLILNRPTRQLESSASPAGAAGQPRPLDRAPPESTPRAPTRQARGEAQMARWLRPSVQAARYAQPGRDRPYADDELDG